VNFRRLLLILPLAALLLASGTWYWLLHTESGARFVWRMAVSATNDALGAASLTGDINSGVTLSRIEFDNDTVIVLVAEVTLEADVDLLPLRVAVESAQASGIEVRLVDEADTDDEGTNIRETLGKLELPVDIELSNIAIRDISVSGRSGDEIFMASSATLAGRWKDGMEIDGIDVVMPEAIIHAAGTLQLVERNDVAIEANVELQPLITGLDKTVSIDVTVSGPLDELSVSAASSSPVTTASGKIAGIGNNIRWQLQLEMPEFSLPPGTGIPALPPVQITAEGAGDLQSLAAEARVAFHSTDMQLTLGTELNIETLAVISNLHWRNAHWPIGAREPRVESRTGRMTIAGSLDDWTINGTLELDVPQLPPGHLTVDGRGNRDGASVDILDSNVLGGSVTGRAEYRWRDPQAYSANLDLRNIHTSALLPDWPAVLNGRAAVNGRQQPFELSAELTDIHGKLQDRSLQAGGRIEISNGAATADDLWLRHGDTIVRVDGQPYSSDGLRYELDIDDLGHYAEGAFGAMSVAGALSLQPDNQFLVVEASSEVISYDDLRITNLVARNGSTGASVVDVEVLADAVTYATFQTDDVQVGLSMDRQSQALDLQFTTNKLGAGISITGMLDSWNKPSSWAGKVTRLDVNHEVFSGSLQEPQDIFMSRESANLQRLCVIGTDDMSLCADGSWRAGTGTAIKANLSSVPVGLLNAFIETRLEFDQLVSGVFDWRTNVDGTVNGRAGITITPGTIVSVDNPDVQLETGDGELSFDVNNNNLQAGIVKLPIPELGQIAAEFEIYDLTDEGSAGISGLIDVDLAEIQTLAAFLPWLDDAGGSLRADLNVSGALEEPSLTGNLILERGRLSYRPAGLKLDDIELRSELQEHGEIELTGSFRAGDGRGEIHTRADHARTVATGIEVRLRGENLTLINVPDVRAVANADVGINFDGETIDVAGRIEIPRARISPANIGMSRVSESADVIIIAGELPDDPTETTTAGKLRMTGSMEVAFGNDVVVNLDVAQASVTGSAVYTWSGDLIPTANGRYDIDGEILAFGQKLEITEGAVRFPDIPADDPFLRIRAEREIYGNTQVRRAGVLVAGTVSRPTIEAYTNPLTTEERALTLLVTGSDFDYEKGVGAIDFGTYISPRVYASYGIGLFDEENVIRIRYDLQRGFGITGTSGQRDSGVDLSYRIEN